jgi:hypothetical protein
MVFWRSYPQKRLNEMEEKQELPQDLQLKDSIDVQLITSPCARYLEEARNHALFLSRTLEYAGAFDKIVEIIVKSLPAIEEAVRNISSEQKGLLDKDILKLIKQFLEGQESGEILGVISESRSAMANIVITHKQLLMELLLCRAVDNFLTYLSEILALIYRSRPEMLRSNETIRLEVILEYETMDDLITFLVEKRVNDLSYQGIQKLADYLSNKLGFDLFERSNDLDTAIRIIETRNIIVHNRAVINDRFLSRVQNFPLGVGEHLHLNHSGVFEDFMFLSQSAKNIDAQAIGKFKLTSLVEKNPLW